MRSGIDTRDYNVVQEDPNARDTSQDSFQRPLEQRQCTRIGEGQPKGSKKIPRGVYREILAGLFI